MEEWIQLQHKADNTEASQNLICTAHMYVWEALPLQLYQCDKYKIYLMFVNKIFRLS